MAGAYLCTATAFDAVEQIVILDLVKVPGVRIPVQLLWQQTDRAYVCAVAAADTGTGSRDLWRFPVTRCKDAIRCLYGRHAIVGQGKPHHRPAHQQSGYVVRIATTFL